MLRIGYRNGRKADPAGISLPGDDAHFVHVALSGPHALLPVAVVAVVWMNQGLPTSPCLQFSDAIAGNALEARGRRLDADGAVRIDLAGIGVVGGKLRQEAVPLVAFAQETLAGAQGLLRLLAFRDVAAVDRQAGRCRVNRNVIPATRQDAGSLKMHGNLLGHGLTVAHLHFRAPECWKAFPDAAP